MAARTQAAKHGVVVRGRKFLTYDVYLNLLEDLTGGKS